MKIAITADWHHAPGFTDLAFIRSMVSRILAREPRLIVHAGDIGESQKGINYIRVALRTIAGLECDSAGCAGNHDIWTDGVLTSLEIWERILPEIFQQEGCHYLENSNWVQDGVAVVGSYLHYDYSAQDYLGLAVDSINNKFAHLSSEEFFVKFRCKRENFPDLTLEQFYARYKYQVNNDGQFLIGLPSDIAFAQKIGEGFRHRLQAAEDDSDVHGIVIVTHVPCMHEQITRHPFNIGWSLGTPYFGNLSHVDFIMGLTKVKHIVSGHSHQENRNIVTFHDGHEVLVQNLKAEYGEPTALMVEV